MQSHPPRVRGLKLLLRRDKALVLLVAPYTGAWIEIRITINVIYTRLVAPYTGAWIEIISSRCSMSPVRVAPYTGAWIEIQIDEPQKPVVPSHPTRVRGLK